MLQYLALDWIEQTLTNNDFNLPIPLLIELRNYVRDRDAGTCNNFLEYYHKGPNCFFHLNQHKLHEQLKAGNALVMFDGLDEIFELAKREEVITSIHRFTNEYPDVQVIVTSRIIGYKQQQLRDAEFRHLMLQDLEPAQIKDFIERWHDKTFSQAEERDKNIKRERLQRVINESKAIAELAQNPLLLTMMAILNLKRELPRDRGELYKDASEVLLHNWDEGRNLKPDERLEIIDYKDKQAMLRQVAYQMQTSEKGLAGNIIYGDDLEAIFTKYLQSIPVNDARDKARRLMKQLRDRNFILCFLGADYYAFVHRTFLEFFCASEFVRQFEKERSITIEGLKTEVFGKYWHDETWHEVLRLIAGMIGEKFVGEILEYLMVQDGEEEKFINLFLAANCLAEVRNRLVIESTATKLLNKLKNLTKYDLWYYYYSQPSYREETKLVKEIRTQAVTAIATTWQESLDIKIWLKQRATQDDNYFVRRAAVKELANHFKDDSDNKTWLKECATQDSDSDVRSAAVEELANHFKDDPDTKTWLKQRATQDDRWFVQGIAVKELAKNFKDDPDTKTWLKQRATQDDHWFVRSAAIEELAQNFKNNPDTKTWLKQLATQDDDKYVRCSAVEELAKNFKDDPDTKTWLKQLASQNSDSSVRCPAVRELAKNFKDDPETKSIIKERATQDDNVVVRGVAVRELTKNFKDDPDTKSIIKERATQDDDEYVRCAAVQELAKHFKYQLELFDIYYQCAVNDPFKDSHDPPNNPNPRRIALEIIIKQFPQHEQTLPLLRDKAENDPDEEVREFAQKKLKQWKV
ncbi:hypothetical protein BV375_34260 [Nostoc sp. 106C]|nr:hypothetical protein BV375_34260 [Nostoc sp. 106C]